MRDGLTVMEVWPLESDHQIELFNRIDWYRRGPVDPSTMKATWLPGYEDLAFVTGSANGEERKKQQNNRTGKKFSPAAQKLQRMGVKDGYPDVEYAAPGSYGGIEYIALYIELKRPGNKALKISPGTLQPSQKNWLDFFTRKGALAVPVWGCGDAIDLLFQYMGLDRDPSEMNKPRAWWL